MVAGNQNKYKCQISKEEFIYKFLTEYNKIENNIKESNNIVDVKLRAIRNTLCHNLETSINELNKFVSFNEILELFGKSELTQDLEWKINKFIWKSNDLEEFLKGKSYKKIVEKNSNNEYIIFQKNLKSLYFNVFYHITSSFISFSITTYNHNDNGKREYYDGKYYIEVERTEDSLLFKTWNYDFNEILKPKIEVYLKDKIFSEILLYIYDNDKLYNPIRIFTPERYKLLNQYFDHKKLKKLFMKCSGEFNVFNDIAHKFGLKDCSDVMKKEKP